MRQRPACDQTGATKMWTIHYHDVDQHRGLGCSVAVGELSGVPRYEVLKIGDLTVFTDLARLMELRDRLNEHLIAAQEQTERLAEDARERAEEYEAAQEQTERL